MATTTPRLGLIKPAGGESLDVSVVNANMDDLDLNTSTLVCTSTTRPAGANRFTGQQIFETDTGRTLLWNGTTWVGAIRYGDTGVTSPPDATSHSADSNVAYIQIPSRNYGRLIIATAAVTATFSAASAHALISLGYDNTLDVISGPTLPVHGLFATYIVAPATANGPPVSQSMTGLFTLAPGADVTIRAVISGLSSGTYAFNDLYGFSLKASAIELGLNAADQSDWVHMYN